MNGVERAALLAVLDEAQRRGFFGPGGLEEPLRHALGFATLLPDAAGFDGLDLGSGGGLPVLPLAIVRPDARWTLVDAMAKRTEFLQEAVIGLGLEARVTVVTGRAETLPVSWRGRFDVVTARGFGPPAVLAECAAPWLRTDGVLVVSEPPGGRPERWPLAGTQRLGLELELLVAGPPSFARLRQVAPCPTTYPRRVGVPAKRPLW